ncbi:unnamed protein product [Allacma fusca]|uniref:Sphingomyelin phosphodiesterase n=1 Tax=Allacma fusca TaxID=39272 RepID=A0A8J2KR76_9HEXA|nr:unnamed protein product [Allacma fusca]
MGVLIFVEILCAMVCTSLAVKVHLHETVTCSETSNSCQNGTSVSVVYENFVRLYNISALVGLPDETAKATAGMSQSSADQYLNDVIPAYFQITQRCFNIRFYLDMLISRIRLGGSVNQIEEMVISICPTLDACTGIVFQQLGCTTNDPYVEWNIDDPNDFTSTEGPDDNASSKMPIRKNDVLKTKISAGKLCPIEAPSSGKIKVPLYSETPSLPLKILHLTDIHVDRLYTVGSNAVCENQILCCHEDDGKPANQSVTAGKYGTGKGCDLPTWTFENALKSIKISHPSLDLIYISGDFIPHNMWRTSKADNIREIEYVSSVLRNYFQDTQMIPILGNHEPHPVNMFSPVNAPSALSTRWVFNVTKNSWMNWIPPEAAQDYIQHHYYSIQINKKFRVLVINTSICFGFNFWQLYSFDDFKSQLQWLRSQLKMSVELQESVHIIGHVPPGHIQCSKVFSRHYNNVIAKYNSVVKGQFFGHTHVDTFRLLYNENGQPISTQWVSPSLTPFRTNNPGYKIYHVDRQSFEVIDHETYIFDLAKANANEMEEPVWFKLYSATALYQVPDVRLANLGLIIDKMAKNESLFHEYYRLHKKGVDSQQSDPCGLYCRKRSLCRIVTPYFGDTTECNRIQMKIDGVVVPIYYDDPL